MAQFCLKWLMGTGKNRRASFLHQGKILGILGNLLSWERILRPTRNSYLASPKQLRPRALPGFAGSHYYCFAQKIGRGARSGQEQPSPCGMQQLSAALFLARRAGPEVAESWGVSDPGSTSSLSAVGDAQTSLQS